MILSFSFLSKTSIFTPKSYNFKKFSQMFRLLSIVKVLEALIFLTLKSQIHLAEQQQSAQQYR